LGSRNACKEQSRQFRRRERRRLAGAPGSARPSRQNRRNFSGMFRIRQFDFVLKFFDLQIWKQPL
jgi:hypothetical protein